MTDYLKNISVNNEVIPVGGNNFDGQWVAANIELISGTMTANQNLIVDCSFLPDDGCDYELAIIGFVNSPAVSGQNSIIAIYQGSTTTKGAVYLGSTRATNNVSQVFGYTTYITVLADDRHIVVANRQNNVTGYCHIWIKGYRRIGKNNPETTNFIEKININNEVIPIGGNNFDGQWVTVMERVIYNQTLNANGGTVTIDLSPYIPNDGEEYEVIFSNWHHSGNTAHQYTALTCNSKLNLYLSSVKCVTAATYNTGGNCMNVVTGSNRTVTLSNNGTSPCNGTTLYLVAYRRIGENGTANNYITNMNTMGKLAHFGGYKFDSPWVYKLIQLGTINAPVNNQYYSFSLADYLPNDGYNYELLAESYISTGPVANNTIESYLSSDNGTTKQMICRINTKVASSGAVRATSIVPVLNGSRTLYTVHGGGTANANSVISVYLHGYRRTGTNE